MNLAALQAWFGLNDDYHTTRQRMLAWAADTDDATIANQVAKLTCLRPTEEARMREAALTLARKAVALWRDNKVFLPWAQLALGMAVYRNAHYEQAATTLATAATTASDTNNEANLSRIEGTANFYRAMCLFQQGKPEEARALFTATQAKIKPLPADEKNPLADTANHDDLILWLAYQEAKALLAEPHTAGK